MHLGSNEESPRDVRIHQNALSYRADIDGIRALAVLLVLFFHVGFDWAPGGYVGVDVFFCGKRLLNKPISTVSR